MLWRLNPYWLKGNLPLDRLFCKSLLWHFFHLVLVLNFVSCLDIRSPGWTSLPIPPVEFYSCSPLSTLWMMFSSFWKEMYLIYIPLYISYTWKSLEQTALLDKTCCILVLINTFSPYLLTYIFFWAMNPCSWKQFLTISCSFLWMKIRLYNSWRNK